MGLVSVFTLLSVTKPVSSEKCDLHKKWLTGNKARQIFDQTRFNVGIRIVALVSYQENEIANAAIHAARTQVLRL